MQHFIQDIIAKYAEKESITVLTAYDYTFARLVDSAGIDIILVGDSLGNVIQGNKTTLPVTMEEMIYHAKCVVKGVSRALVVCDMPFLSFQSGIDHAIESAGRLIKEAGVGAVKLEGGRRTAEAIRRIVEVGIPVMGHIGLTPQSYHIMGGYKVQGKTEEAAEMLYLDALALQEAGTFAVVLEGIPANLAQRITEALEIPTIGIGSGVNCSGQVLVLYDLLGLTFDRDLPPKFIRKYADLAEISGAAVKKYIEEVHNRKFPGPENSY